MGAHRGPMGSHGGPWGACGVDFVSILVDVYRFWLIYDEIFAEIMIVDDFTL